MYCINRYWWRHSSSPTTLTLHHAFTISFQAQNSPFPKNFFNHSLLAPTWLPSRTVLERNNSVNGFHFLLLFLHGAIAAAQCIVIGPVCLWVCACVCMWLFYHDNSPNWFVGKGSDHLQLIKFCPSRVPGKGVCGGANFFGSALLQPRSTGMAVDVGLFDMNIYILSMTKALGGDAHTARWL